MYRTLNYNHLFKTALLLMFCSLTLSPLDTLASNYQFKQSQNGERTFKMVLNESKAPNIHFSSKCSGSPVVICSNVATNKNGQVIRVFPTGMIAKAKVRYKDIAFAVAKSVGCNYTKCNTYHVVDSLGKISVFTQNNVVTPFVSHNGNAHFITTSKYLIHHPTKGIIKTFQTPEPVSEALFGHNLEGLHSALIIGKSGAVYVFTGDTFLHLGFELAKHGDRNQTLAIYPTKDHIYIVAYRYTNAFNKGVYALKYSLNEHRLSGGWLVNSETHNIGATVSVYKEREQVIIGATNTTLRRKVHYIISDAEFDVMNHNIPSHIQKSGFENEALLSFMVGATIAKVDLSLDSSVPYSSQFYPASLEVSLSQSLLKGVYFEGRIGNYPLAIQYLKNEVENTVANNASSDGNAINKYINQAASHKLVASVDFTNLLPSSITTRLQYSNINLSGVAKVSDKFNPSTTHAFTTRLERSSLLFINEGGYFLGAEYKQLTSPTMVGFSNSAKNTVYSGVDLKTNYETYKIILGYDHMAYAKRYETNLKDWYWSGNINAGLSFIEFSPEFKADVMNRVFGQSFSKNELKGEIGLDAELGYMWQQRFRQWKGLGYSIGAGYLFQGTYLRGSRPDNQENLIPGTIYSNISYTLYSHGPFLRLNIVF